MGKAGEKAGWRRAARRRRLSRRHRSSGRIKTHRRHPHLHLNTGKKKLLEGVSTGMKDRKVARRKEGKKKGRKDAGKKEAGKKKGKKTGWRKIHFSWKSAIKKAGEK